MNSTELIEALYQVIREYRKNGQHQGCYDLSAWKFDGNDYRCATCIKADALLPKEER